MHRLADRNVRCVTGAACVLGLMLIHASHARAQPTIDWRAQRAEAGVLSDWGIGLTVAGLGAGALGTGLYAALTSSTGDYIGAEQVLPGSILWAVGGAVLLSGVPTWIVGAVRASLSDAAEQDRARVADDWERAGIGVFVGGLAVSALGAALFGGALASNGDDPPGLLLSGFVMIPVGLVIAAFVGAPMWAEGARF